MKKIIIFLFFVFFNNAYAEKINKYFHIGLMESYDKKFTLYFKTREKAIIAKGEYRNYLNDYPQDLYIHDHKTKKDYPLISYEWFPKRVKKITNNFEYPMFPEDFAYYLLNDNDTLILVSASKNFFKNLKFSISNKHLSTAKSLGKLEFIVSSFANHLLFHLNQVQQLVFYIFLKVQLEFLLLQYHLILSLLILRLE